VAIPDVTGQSEHAAELNIRRRGLDVASLAQMQVAGIPADQVLAQNPTANATQVLAPKISLLVTAPVAADAYVMPSFVGQLLGTANRTLLDSGFRLGNVSVAAPVPTPAVDATAAAGQTAPAPVAVTSPVPTPEPSPASVIVSQSPGAGQRVVAGTTVSFEVR
jgi:beta-lactam-binding protein with PASTA domain